MEDFVPFLFRHSTQVLLFLILLFVATPEAKKEQLVTQLRWIVAIGAAWYFLKPFIFIALAWAWKHRVVSVLIGFIVASLGAWIYDSRQNRAIRREYKTMGAASPAFKQRVSYMVSNGCDNEKAVATVTGIASGQKIK
jgi:uncharacterized membrane protein YczE